MVAMRKAAEQHSRGPDFNAFLAELASRYEHDRQHRSFWQSIIREHLIPIGTAQEVEDFLKQHNGAQVCFWLEVVCSLPL